MAQDYDERLGGHLQDCILRLAIESDEFLKLVLPPVMTPKLLGTRIAANIFRVCIDYYKEYRKAPGNNFHTEVVEFILSQKKEEHESYINYIQKIRKLPSPDIDYVVGKISTFVRKRTLEQSAIKFAELISRGDVQEAEALMAKALKSGIPTFEIGLDYLKNELPLRLRGSRQEYLMKTGFGSPIDDSLGGYKRGQFVCIMGSYKGKKSWACVHLGVTALMRGLTVVHISHEMTLEEVEQRYDMAIGSLASIKEPESITVKIFDQDSGTFDLEDIRPGSTFDKDAVSKARGIMTRFGGRLVIKKYPMGMADMLEVDRYLEYLESFGIVPDVLINDYADIQKPINSRTELRHQLNETYIYHKRLADERNILVITATQVPDAAVKKSNVTIKDFANDRRKAGNVDIALAVCCTDEQEAENESTIVVVANRSGPQGARCNIGTYPQIGQMVLWSESTKRSWE